MPRGIYKRTEEHKRNLSNSLKGRKAWNKGVKVNRTKYPKMGHFQKHSKETIEKLITSHIGQIAWNKGLKLPNISGEKSSAWKGDSVGYSALHAWVRKVLGEPKKCSKCGTTTAKRYEWANLSGKYKRDIKDWIRLCKSCHLIYDETWINKKRNKLGQFIPKD